jgi:hypothetical protein
MMRFKFLPHALQVMCAILMLAPLGALAALALNSGTALALPVWYLAYLAVIYAVMPWVLALLVLKRHAAFLYVFAVEALLLIAHNFIGTGYVEMPAFLRFTQYGYAMITSVMALMLVNRDLLFPFIFERYRGFRRAPRIELNQRVTVRMPRIDKEFVGMVEDASLTGLAIYGFEEAMSDVLSFAQRGEPLVVTYASPKQTLSVQGWFLWSAQTSSICKIGFRAADLPIMEAFFATLGLDRKSSGLRQRLLTAWGKRGVRRVLNYGFALAILALLMMPVVDRGPAAPAPVPAKPKAQVTSQPKAKKKLLKDPPKILRAH